MRNGVILFAQQEQNSRKPATKKDGEPAPAGPVPAFCAAHCRDVFLLIVPVARSGSSGKLWAALKKNDEVIHQRRSSAVTQYQGQRGRGDAQAVRKPKFAFSGAASCGSWLPGTAQGTILIFANDIDNPRIGEDKEINTWPGARAGDKHLLDLPPATAKVGPSCSMHCFSTCSRFGHPVDRRHLRGVRRSRGQADLLLAGLHLLRPCIWVGYVTAVSVTNYVTGEPGGHQDGGGPRRGHHLVYEIDLKKKSDSAKDDFGRARPICSRVAQAAASTQRPQEHRHPPGR